MTTFDDKPRQLSRTVIYENNWVSLYIDRVAFPGGRIIEQHHVLDFKRKSVGMVVENASGDILMVEAYRYVVDRIQWEIPAGGVETGESLLAAAQREVLEETGYQTEGHRLVYQYYPINGIGNAEFNLIYCRATVASGQFDRSEVRDVRWFSRANLQKMIAQHQIRDGYSLTGLLLHFNAGHGDLPQ